MESLKDKIKRIKSEYLSLKDEYDCVISKIQSERNFYEEGHDNLFRKALCLHLGLYKYPYEYEWPNGFNISVNKEWKSDNYLKNYSIFKYHENIGKICKKKDIISTFKYKHRNIWLWYVKNNTNYTKSLSEFISDCEFNRINFYEILDEYLCNEEKSSLSIINELKLKIKDVIIYLI